MKIVIHGWLVFLALIAALNTASADSVTIVDNDTAFNKDQPIVDPADQQMISLAFGKPAVVAPNLQQPKMQRRVVRIPAALVDRIAFKAIPVGHHHHRQAIQLKSIRVSKAQVKIIGHRLVSDWSAGQLQPAFWLEEVRVTFPRHYIAGSWDVQALQRELERLGIKIKPKPAAPKPSVQQLSG